MRRLAILTALLALAVVGQVAARETVFFDLAWGDPVEVLGDAILVDEDDTGMLQMYAKVREVSHLGTIELQSVVYLYFDGKLTGVTVKAADHRRLRDAMNTRYGKPAVEDRIAETATWRQGDTVATYKKESFPVLGVMTLASFSIFAEYGKWEAERSKKDASSW